MKEKGLLFSTDMVKALLDEKKDANTPPYKRPLRLYMGWLCVRFNERKRRRDE